MVHITLSGEVRQTAGGLQEQFREGDVVWYHEAEPVTGEVIRAPWRFITIGFSAPGLSPPSLDCRVLPGGARTMGLAHELLQIWQDEERPSLERALLATSRLAELVLDFAPLEAFTPSLDRQEMGLPQRWWQVERLLRQRLEESFSLQDIAHLARMSNRTLNRACHLATGDSPARRLREIRLSYARGLLEHTPIPVTEVAFRVGFARVQEFSRDYKKQYGMSPSQVRKRDR
ncbi:helix-turn-helix transcriptional regulator [Roseibacillus ishigakijimensis]|uniref:Helix-turn-helix transcriptional regulator n=1 Tax=Roseibacillus ishigakijimensis TaxID=454146 RepID=A0A934RL59_9BACT|nr:helix-turn-helix transcriptional regulator [Roseibacillus ishigakijimensis]